MNLSRINTIIYKTACVASCGVLFILGIKIIFDNLFVKGMLALVCAAIFGLMLLQKPSVRTWLQVIVVMVIAIMIIGQLERI
jgi:hypothetical protein